MLLGGTGVGVNVCVGVAVIVGVSVLGEGSSGVGVREVIPAGMKYTLAGAKVGVDSVADCTQAA